MDQTIEHRLIRTLHLVGKSIPRFRIAWALANDGNAAPRSAAARTIEAEIIAFCRAHMSGFKTPKAVVFGPIPKTSTEKKQKFVLRNQFGEGDFGLSVSGVTRHQSRRFISPQDRRRL